MTAIPAAAGTPCGRCNATGDALKFRYYKRVVGLLFVDRIYAAAGYFVPSCRRKLFAKHFLLTAIFGWWGIIALYFRNPLAILVNVWALFAPPMSPQSYGAFSAADAAAAAAEDEQGAGGARAQWWAPSDLSPAELALVAADLDYYALLGVSPMAPPEVLRSAHRALLKKHHPDIDRTDSAHSVTVAINTAYEVLSDVRLRAAYDGYRAATVSG